MGNVRLTFSEKFESRVYEKTGTSAFRLTTVWNVPTFSSKDAMEFGQDYGDEWVWDDGSNSGLYVTEKTVTPMQNQTDNEYSEMTIVYETANITIEPDGISWDLDLTAQTAHITHVAKAEDHIVYPAQALDVRGTAIGKRKDGSIEGTDIYEPAGVLTIYNKIFKSDYSYTYQRQIYDMARTVNNTRFWGWDAGELLFLGPTVHGATREKVTLQFKFLISANVSSKPILMYYGDTINIDKDGWQALKSEMGSLPKLIVNPLFGQEGEPRDITIITELPKSIHVYTVYKTSSFVDMGLPADAPIGSVRYGF